MNKFLWKSIILLSLVGCSIYQEEYKANLAHLLTTATDESYGKQPETYHQKIIEAMIKAQMKDPDSVKFIWNEPVRCNFPAKNSRTTPLLGWCVKVAYNAKNSFGAYVGYKLREYRYVDGNFYSVCSHEPHLGWSCY